MPTEQQDRKVVRLHDYAQRRRTKQRPQPDIAVAELEEAMRTIHSAAHAALKLVFMARHRLGLPQL